MTRLMGTDCDSQFHLICVSFSLCDERGPPTQRLAVGLAGKIEGQLGPVFMDNICFFGL